MYEFVKENISRFDTSNYKENNQHKMPLKNAKVVLLMKDEMGGDVIDEFVALGAKQYAITTAENGVLKKVKGITKNTVKRHISADDYKRVLFQQGVEKREQVTIQSRNHNLHTIKRQKIALRLVDDKRVQVADFCTLPHGHVDLHS